MLLISPHAHNPLLEQHMSVYKYPHATVWALGILMQDIKERYHQWYIGYGKQQLQPTATP